LEDDDPMSIIFNPVTNRMLPAARNRGIINHQCRFQLGPRVHRLWEGSVNRTAAG
jgi:hypothetical protein